MAASMERTRPLLGRKRVVVASRREGPELAPAADVLQFLVNGERKLISVCQLVEEEDAVTAAQF